MADSTIDWGLVFDTLLLIAFLRSDAETPEAAAEKFVKELFDIPETVDLLAETPEERRARSAKWYAQEWEKIMQEIEYRKIPRDREIQHWDDAGDLGGRFNGWRK